MKLKSFIQLILLAALWGASFHFMKIAVPNFGASLLVTIRVLSAALFMGLVCLWFKHPLKKCNLHIYVFLGVTNTAIPFLLFAYAAHTLSGSLMSIMNAASPVWGALCGIVILKEKVTPMAALGLIFGIIGVTVVGWNGVAINGDNALIPVLASLGATFCYGIGSTYAKKYSKSISPLENAQATLWVASTIFIVITLLSPHPDLKTIPFKPWAAAISLGLFSTGIAYLLFFNLLKNEGSMKTLSVTFLIPVFAILWGVLLMSETITPITLLGGSIIIIGTLLTNGIISKKSISKRRVSI